MNSLALKKKSLEDSLKGHTAQVEDEGRIEVSGENKVGELLEKCESYCNKVIYSSAITEVLTPEELNRFLQATVLFEDIGDEKEWYVANFMNLLIKNSYDAGHNNFVFNMPGLPIKTLGVDQKFSGFSPARITTNGFAGALGYRSSSARFTSNGDVGKTCGAESSDVNFLINGNAGYGLGRDSKRSRFEVFGNVGYGCGAYSEDCTFIIGGDVGIDFGAHAFRSTFKTPNERTMKKFLEMVPLTYFDGQYKPSQNILIFMNKNGKEEVVRNC